MEEGSGAGSEGSRVDHPAVVSEPLLNRQRAKRDIAFLVVEGVLIFVLGTAGSALSKSLNLSAGWLLMIVVAVIVVLALVQFVRDRPSVLKPRPEEGRQSTGAWVLSRSAALVPLALFLGALSGFVLVTFGPNGPAFRIGSITLVWRYELLGFLIAVVLGFGLSRRVRSWIVDLCGALAFATSFAASETLLRPYSNAFLLTLGGWYLAMTALVIAESVTRGKTLRDSWERLLRFFSRDG